MHGIRLQSCWWYRLASLWNLGIARLGCLLTRSSIVQFHPGELLSNVYILTTPSAASLLYTSSISTYPTRKILIIIVISTYVLVLICTIFVLSLPNIIKTYKAMCYRETIFFFLKQQQRIIPKATLIVSASLLLSRFGVQKALKLF